MFDEHQNSTPVQAHNPDSKSSEEEKVVLVADEQGDNYTTKLGKGDVDKNDESGPVGGEQGDNEVSKLTEADTDAGEETGLLQDQGYKGQEAAVEGGFNGEVFTKELVALGFSVFLHLCACFIVLPSITPLVVDVLYHGDISSGAHFIAYMQLLAAGIEFFTMPLIGALSDTYGRKPFLMISIVAFTVAFTVVSITQSMPAVIFANCFRATFGGFMVITTAQVVDLSRTLGKTSSNPNNLTSMMAVVFAMGVSALIIGSGAGAFLGREGASIAFVTAASLEGFNLVFVFLVIPETLHIRIGFSLAGANMFSAAHLLCGNKVRIMMVSIVILITIASTAFSQIFIYLKYRFGWNAFEIGLLLMATGVSAVSALAVGILYLLPRYGERKIIIFALVLGTSLFYAIGLSNAGWQIFVFMIAACFSALGFPASRGLLSKQIPTDVQGKAQGSLGAISTIINGVGPLVCSFLFSYSVDNLSNKKTDAFDPGAGLVFYIMGIFFVLALILTVILPEDAERATLNQADDESTVEETTEHNPVAKED